MSAASLSQVGDRYEAARCISQGTAELHAVADEAGARLDLAVQRLGYHVRGEDPEIWQDLLSAARAMRWRLVTNPAPPAYRAPDGELLEALTNTCGHMGRTVDEQTRLLLADLTDRASQAHTASRPTGTALLEALADLDFRSCVVFAASGRAQAALKDWFVSLRISVPVLAASSRQPQVVEQAYAVGPPSFFGAPVLTAPKARAIAYVLPSWVRERTLPESPLAAYAEGAINPRLKIFQVGREPVLDPPPPARGDQLAPAPTWPPPTARPPRADEVMARKVLLSAGLAIWLDQEGEHIRSLHPARATGRRIELTDVPAIVPGSYLVLREGQTQSTMLYERALTLLAKHGREASDSQQRWKRALQNRIDQLGATEVARQLARAGVKCADRAHAWAQPTVVRPQVDQDFKLLLAWLGFPEKPHYALAAQLRSARQRALHEIREALEAAVSCADLATLEREGFLRLELPDRGFRGMIATRVLAICPYTEPVRRTHVRQPFEDRRGGWLE